MEDVELAPDHSALNFNGEMKRKIDVSSLLCRCKNKEPVWADEQTATKKIRIGLLEGLESRLEISEFFMQQCRTHDGLCKLVG